MDNESPGAKCTTGGVTVLGEIANIVNGIICGRWGSYLVVDWQLMCQQKCSFDKVKSLFNKYASEGESMF